MPETGPSGAPSAFAGITVVEDASGVAGPYCAKLLADLGAEVIKVEPLTGDPARRHGPFAEASDVDGGALFLYCNSNKGSITLDLDIPSGRALFARLLDAADVFISDRRASDLVRLGLSPAAVAVRWPSLVFLSVTPYGLSGPRAEAPSYELDTFFSSGEGALLPGGLSYQLFPDRQPVKAGRFLPDYDAGIAGAGAIAAALIRRELGGGGEVVELSHQETEISVGRYAIALQLGENQPMSRRTRGYDYGGILPCRDGYFIVRPNEDNHWRGLTQAIGRPELADDPRFVTRKDRHDHGRELNAILTEWAHDKSPREIYDAVLPAGTPVGFFADAQAVVESPQMQARGFIAQLPLGETFVAYPAAPYQLSRTPWRLRDGAPRLGQDTAAVCANLGVGVDEQRRLREAGVI